MTFCQSSIKISKPTIPNLGHRPWSSDASGNQLCDGSQWTSHHEHAHRLPTGNICDDIVDIDQF